jgi:hypothetical protein
MIQAHIIVRYSVITEIPRVVHEITFTAVQEAISFVRDNQRWFSRTEVVRQIRVEQLSLADLEG